MQRRGGSEVFERNGFQGVDAIEQEEVEQRLPPMKRVVIDTNVQLGLWIFREPSLAVLRAGLADRMLQAVRSTATDAEFAEVLARPDLLDVDPTRQVVVLDEWQARATLIDSIIRAPWTCRDPLDQKFLDLAVSAGAQWLLTRDRDLLKLAKKARRGGLAILTPERWMPDDPAL